MLSIIQFLDKIQPLNEDIQQYLFKHLKQKRLNPGGVWLKKGEICENVAFIEEGLLKSVYKKNERTYINWFMKENDVVISVNSFFRQIPSHECLIAIESSLLYYISHDELNYLNTYYKSFQLITSSLMALYYERCQDRTELLRLYRNERFVEFLRTEVLLKNRITGRDMAAYLGISEERLSQLRSQLVFNC
ncbi:MAG: Crp/Fnr family transcriptional regulator [Flavisolibacter sp.]